MTGEVQQEPLRPPDCSPGQVGVQPPGHWAWPVRSLHLPCGHDSTPLGLLCLQKFPDTLVSLEGNTEVPGMTSSEPLLPS